MISARIFIRRPAPVITMLACAGVAAAQGFVWNMPILDRAPAVIGIHKTATASDGDTALILNLGPQLKLPKVALLDTAIGSMAWEVELPPTCLAKAYEGYAIGQAVAFAPDGDVIVLATTVNTGVVCVVRYARNDGRIVWQYVERPPSGTDQLMDATQLVFDQNGDTFVGGARRVVPGSSSSASWRARVSKLDRHTGNPLWTFESPLHADRRYSRATQLAVGTDGRALLLSFYGGTNTSIPAGYSLTRLDSAGLPLWEQGAATSVTGSLDASEGMLRVLGDGSAVTAAWQFDRATTGLRRFDAVSGNTMWSREWPEWVGAMTTGPDDEVLISSPAITRLNPANGQSAWELARPPAPLSWSDPIAVGGSKALVVESNATFSNQRWIRSIDLVTGTVGSAVPVSLARPGGATANFVRVHSVVADAASGRASLVAFVRIDNGANQPSNVFATSIEGRSATVGSTIDSVPTLKVTTSSWFDDTVAIVTGDQDVVGTVFSAGRQLYVKLAGSDGTERWRVAATSGGSASGLVAIGSNGDFVHATPKLTRRSGVDGHVIWSVPSPAGAIARPLVDAAGDIVAVVNLGNLPDQVPFPLPNSTLARYGVAKFSGATGALLWLREVATSYTAGPGLRIAARDDRLVVATNGDLIVGGLDAYWAGTGQIRHDGFIARLDPSNGAPRWRQEFPYVGSASVVAFPNADLALVSYSQIARVSAANGQVVWQQPNSSGLMVHAAMVDADGDIVFGSAEQPQSAGGWRIASVDGDTGAPRWSLPVVSGMDATGILHLAQAANGTILAAGRCNKPICIAGFDPATGSQRYRLVREYPNTTDQTHQTMKLMVDALGRVYAALTAPGIAYAEDEPPIVTPAIARLRMPADDALFADSFD